MAFGCVRQQKESVQDGMEGSVPNTSLDGS